MWRWPPSRPTQLVQHGSRDVDRGCGGGRSFVWDRCLRRAGRRGRREHRGRPASASAAGRSPCWAARAARAGRAARRPAGCPRRVRRVLPAALTATTRPCPSHRWLVDASEWGGRIEARTVVGRRGWGTRIPVAYTQGVACLDHAARRVAVVVGRSRVKSLVSCRAARTAQCVGSGERCRSFLRPGCTSPTAVACAPTPCPRVEWRAGSMRQRTPTSCLRPRMAAISPLAPGRRAAWAESHVVRG
jgi:hypothetical protein